LRTICPEVAANGAAKIRIDAKPMQAAVWAIRYILLAQCKQNENFLINVSREVQEGEKEGF
jgi:hypothetical protein